MMRRLVLLGIAAVASACALPVLAADAPKLLIWINGDKGYNLSLIHISETTRPY